MTQTATQPREVSLTEFKARLTELEFMDVEIMAIRANIHNLKATRAVLFECLAMDSTHLGAATVVVGGGQCSHSVEELCGFVMGNAPSNFKYPTMYCNTEGW